MKWIGCCLVFLFLSGCADTRMIDHALPQNVIVSNKTKSFMGIPWKSDDVYLIRLYFHMREYLSIETCVLV